MPKIRRRRLPPSISNALIGWFRDNQRDLPWRQTRDPYAILVSEVMLQQTQVATVVPHYLRFMSRFPTAESLASTTESDALAAWEGLGYYRRLRNLQAAAAVVQSGWPDDLRTLPGVGRYTAAAVGSIAFNKQMPCADGNVRRVWSRFLARDLSVSEAEEQSAKLMPSSHAGEWNQSVMELGATICKPKAPACHRCPISRDCASYRLDCVDEFPAQVAAKTVRLDQVCVCAVRQKRVAIRKCEPGEWWEGMYTFPRTTVCDDESPRAAAARLGLSDPKLLGALTHTVTNHRIRLQAFIGKPTDMPCEWRTLDELAALPMPKPSRRVAQWLEESL